MPGVCLNDQIWHTAGVGREERIGGGAGGATSVNLAVAGREKCGRGRMKGLLNPFKPACPFALPLPLDGLFARLLGLTMNIPFHPVHRPLFCNKLPENNQLCFLDIIITALIFIQKLSSCSRLLLSWA